jgi:hypothetical protein
MGRRAEVCLLLILVGCGGGGDDDGPGGGGDGGADDGDGAPIDPPGQLCTPPLELHDTSRPSQVIGDGGPSGCTEAALRSAAEAGGVITFDCGAEPVTIALGEQIVLPVDTDTIIDGGGLVTLDAGGVTRHFYFDHPDWMNNETLFAIQRIRLVNGAAPAGEYFEQDPDNPLCAYGYKEGSGGAIYMRNGVLHVIDSELYDNSAALIGPDVGGGAIYVLGVPEIVITGSRFARNRGSNGGAVGILFASRPAIVNSVFEHSTAEGVGANYVEAGCPEFNHDQQGGAGGNGGAVVFDGLNDEAAVYTLCGNRFANNRANELGGALFRTPNAGVRRMTIDRCLFDGNTARLGGVSFLMQNEVTVRATTFMHNRSGLDIDGGEIGGPFGGLWISIGVLDLENSTFFDNQPSGLDVDGSGEARSATFVESRPGGSVSIGNSLFVDTECGDTLEGSGNLQWPEAGACAGGASFADPGIGAIGDNGGQTPTFMPAPGGAVEGVAQDCPPTDQRGEPRDSASCAAGSVEP